MKIKLTLTLDLTPDVIEQNAESDFRVWTVCNSGDGDYIENRITSTDALGYLIVPNQITDYLMELV